MSHFNLLLIFSFWRRMWAMLSIRLKSQMFHALWILLIGTEAFLSQFDPGLKGTSHTLVSARQEVFCHAACPSGQGTINQLDFVRACNGGPLSVCPLLHLRPILDTSRLLYHSGRTEEAESVWIRTGLRNAEVWRMLRGTCGTGMGMQDQRASTTGKIGILHKHFRDIFKENGFFLF